MALHEEVVTIDTGNELFWTGVAVFLVVCASSSIAAKISAIPIHWGILSRSPNRIIENRITSTGRVPLMVLTV